MPHLLVEKIVKWLAISQNQTPGEHKRLAGGETISWSV